MINFEYVQVVVLVFLFFDYCIYHGLGDLELVQAVGERLHLLVLKLGPTSLAQIIVIQSEGTFSVSKFESKCII